MRGELVDEQARAAVGVEGFNFHVADHPAVVHLLNLLDPHVAVGASGGVEVFGLGEEAQFLVDPEADGAEVVDGAGGLDFEDVAVAAVEGGVGVVGDFAYVGPPEVVHGEVEPGEVGAADGVGVAGWGEVGIGAVVEADGGALAVGAGEAGALVDLFGVFGVEEALGFGDGGAPIEGKFEVGLGVDAAAVAEFGEGTGEGEFFARDHAGGGLEELAGGGGRFVLSVLRLQGECKGEQGVCD